MWLERAKKARTVLAIKQAVHNVQQGSSAHRYFIRINALALLAGIAASGSTIVHVALLVGLALERIVIFILPSPANLERTLLVAKRNVPYAQLATHVPFQLLQSLKHVPMELFLLLATLSVIFAPKGITVPRLLFSLRSQLSENWVLAGKFLVHQVNTHSQEVIDVSCVPKDFIAPAQLRQMADGHCAPKVISLPKAKPLLNSVQQIALNVLLVLTVRFLVQYPVHALFPPTQRPLAVKFALQATTVQTPLGHQCLVLQDNTA